MDEGPLVEVGHIYIGLNFWSIWGKDYEITELELEKGNLDLYEYEDKSFNVRRAIRPKHKQKNKPSLWLCAPLLKEEQRQRGNVHQKR